MPRSLETRKDAEVAQITADEAYDVYAMVSGVAESPDFSHHFLMLLSAFIGVPGTFRGTSRKLSLPL
ncbi:MAG: hypothetical protein ACXWAC_10455 [Usitatibacter sp.]